MDLSITKFIFKEGNNMSKRVLLIACLALLLISCGILDSITGKDEPQYIVVTATPENAFTEAATDVPVLEPTIERESITITDPVAATLAELAGPFEDSLIRNEKEFIPIYCAEVTVEDFKAQVTFKSLPAFNSRQNSIGIFFRMQGDDNQYRLNIYEDGWQLRNRNGEYNVVVNTGQLDMTWGEAKDNTITLYAVGDTGYFYINKYYIFQLNLSDRVEGGDICVASSIYDDDLYGVVTEFKDFIVWELTPQ